jgi:hypothetical protein
MIAAAMALALVRWLWRQGRLQVPVAGLAAIGLALMLAAQQA